jgi:small GTP-binding protein
VKDEFVMSNISTHGVDFVSKSFQLADGSVVNAFIYDTGGQEKYKAINESYYKKANGVLLVYDITNRKSFDDIINYYCDKIKELCEKNIPIILLGNKTDLEDKRQVSQEEGIELARSNKYIFKETSCVKNENVADAFEALIELWNVEYQKKHPSKTRRNSGDFKKKEDNFIRSNSTVNLKKKQLDSESGNEPNSIRLSKSKTETPQKSHGCCS